MGTRLTFDDLHVSPPRVAPLQPISFAEDATPPPAYTRARQTVAPTRTPYGRTPGRTPGTVSFHPDTRHGPVASSHEAAHATPRMAQMYAAPDDSPTMSTAADEYDDTQVRTE
jgi:hypothetical protein